MLSFACLGGRLLYQSPEQADEAFIVESDAGSVTVRFATPALTAEEGGSPGTVLRVPGWGVLAVEGAPDLPVLRRMVQVPDAGGVELEILDETTVSLGLFDVPPFGRPALRSGGFSPVWRDEAIYGRPDPFPAACAELEGVHVLRDLRVATVRFQPVRFDPSTGEVTLVTSATVRLDFRGRGDNELSRVFDGTTPGFEPFYREVLGFEPSGTFLDGSYVFIGTEETLAAVQELIDWKRQRGYRVALGIVPDIGSTAEEIDAWIELAFAIWPFPPEWLMIVGGEDRVPVPMYEDFASDNIYGVIGTGTSVPSIHVGRITGSLDDLQYQAWKIVQHEANPFEPAGVNWFQKTVVIGSSDGLDPLHSWEHAVIFMDHDLAVDYYCDSPEYGGAPPDISEIAADIDEGRTIVDYIGHGGVGGWGTSGFSISDVQALSNGRMLPWVNSIACSNAAFMGAYCFGEAWMTEGDTVAPKGALGFMGATTGSPFGPTDSLAEYTWRGYFELEIHHMGAAVDYGKLKVEEFYGPDNWGNNWMHMVFGCPEVDIYADTSPIAVLEADHSQYVWAGPWPIYVTGEGGQPVEDALVGVVQDDELLGAGYTDNDGFLSLDLPTLPYGSSVGATVTVTAHNHRPYTASLDPAPAGWEEGGEAVFFLDRAIPSPFSVSTGISFGLPSPAFCNLAVYDLSGRLVRTLVEQDLPAGGHTVLWDGRTGSGELCPDGVYFIRLSIPGDGLTGRVVRLGG